MLGAHTSSGTAVVSQPKGACKHFSQDGPTALTTLIVLEALGCFDPLAFLLAAAGLDCCRNFVLPVVERWFKEPYQDSYRWPP